MEFVYETASANTQLENSDGVFLSTNGVRTPFSIETNDQAVEPVMVPVLDSSDPFLYLVWTRCDPGFKYHAVDNHCVFSNVMIPPIGMIGFNFEVHRHYRETEKEKSDYRGEDNTVAHVSLYL